MTNKTKTPAKLQAKMLQKVNRSLKPGEVVRVVDPITNRTVVIGNPPFSEGHDQYTTYLNYFRTDDQFNGALTQVIPMNVFEADEKNIRKFVKEIDGRIYFRGPRVGIASTTLRKNATGVVIYA